MKDIITEKVEELEARIKNIESAHPIYKASLDRLEKELSLLRQIAKAVDTYQRKTKYIGGEFAELHRLITEYRKEQL